MYNVILIVQGCDPEADYIEARLTNSISKKVINYFWKVQIDSLEYRNNKRYIENPYIEFGLINEDYDDNEDDNGYCWYMGYQNSSNIKAKEKVVDSEKRNCMVVKSYGAYLETYFRSKILSKRQKVRICEKWRIPRYCF